MFFTIPLLTSGADTATAEEGALLCQTVLRVAYFSLRTSEKGALLHKLCDFKKKIFEIIV